MVHSAQGVSLASTGKRLADQVKADRRMLRRAYRKVVEGERRGAEEWLRDNYYLLERSAASAQRELKHLPALPSRAGRPVIPARPDRPARRRR